MMTSWTLSLTDTQLVFPACTSYYPLDPLSQTKGLCICARSDSSSDTASYRVFMSELIKAAVCISRFWIWFPHMQTSNLITHLPIGPAGSPGDSRMCCSCASLPSSYSPYVSSFTLTSLLQGQNLLSLPILEKFIDIPELLLLCLLVCLTR